MSGRKNLDDMTSDDLDQLHDQLTETRAALDEVLRHFNHKGHPGEPCLQTGWISERTVARWRAVLYPPTPAATEEQMEREIAGRVEITDAACDALAREEQR